MLGSLELGSRLPAPTWSALLHRFSSLTDGLRQNLLHTITSSSPPVDSGRANREVLEMKATVVSSRSGVTSRNDITLERACSELARFRFLIKSISAFP